VINTKRIKRKEIKVLVVMRGRIIKEGKVNHLGTIKIETEMGISTGKVGVDLEVEMKRTGMIDTIEIYQTMTERGAETNILIERDGQEVEKTEVEVEVMKKEIQTVGDEEVGIGRTPETIATEIAGRGRVPGSTGAVEVGTGMTNTTRVGLLPMRSISLPPPVSLRSVSDHALSRPVTTACIAIIAGGRDRQLLNARSTRVNQREGMSMRSMMKAAGRLVRPPRGRDHIDRAQGE